MIKQVSRKNAQEPGDMNWKVYIGVRSTTAVNCNGVVLSMFFLCRKICSALPLVQLCVKVSFETWWFCQGPATHLQPPCLWLKYTSVYSVNPNQNCQPWKIFIGFVAKRIKTNCNPEFGCKDDNLKQIKTNVVIFETIGILNFEKTPLMRYRPNLSPVQIWQVIQAAVGWKTRPGSHCLCCAIYCFYYSNPCPCCLGD